MGEGLGCVTERIKMTKVTLETIQAAAERIRPYIHRTPTLTSSRLDAMLGAKIVLKCENLQKVGAFKARGACNAVLSLSDDACRKGVVTHSSGNHGAALAWAAKMRGIEATVVVPKNAPIPKKKAIEAYGATIVECEPTVESREGTVRELIAQHGFELVHPFDDDRIIAGQGTAALELLEDHPDLDVIMAPLGGGGLLSGTVIAVKSLRKEVAVYGGEPKGADDGYRSFQSGVRVTQQTPNTLCDGLRTTLAERTFDIIRSQADGIVVATDATIIRTMRLVWESTKMIVESSCMPPLAAIFEDPEPFRAKKIGIILTGGNVDLDRLPWQCEETK